MKFFYFSIITLFICSYTYSQVRVKQPMGILPASMKYAEGASVVNTICVDFFSDVPKAKDFYDHIIYRSPIDRKQKVIKQFDRKWQIEGIEDTYEMTLLNLKSKDVQLSNQDLFIIDQYDNRLTKRFEDFLQEIVNDYKQNLPFDRPRHEQLQVDVWRYNIYEKMGYLSGEGNVLDDFRQAKKRFIHEFALDGLNDIENTDELLLQILYEITGGNTNTADFTLMQLLQEIGKENKSGVDEMTIVVTKSPSTNEYLVFNDLSQPIYRGKNTVELAKLLDNLSNNKQPMKLLSGGMNVWGELDLLTNLNKSLSDNNSSLKVTSKAKLLLDETISKYFDDDIISDLSKVKHEITEGESLRVRTKTSEDFNRIIESVKEEETCLPILCISAEGEVTVVIACLDFEIEISSADAINFTLVSGNSSITVSNQSSELNCKPNAQVCVSRIGADIDTSVECSDGNFTFTSSTSWQY